MIVRLKGVKKVAAKGQVYYYHRKTMTRLPDDPHSAEFVARMRELDAKTKRATAPGTLGALIKAYRASPEFANLASSTKRNYQRVFDDLHNLDGMPLSKITAEWLFALRDKKARDHKRTFPNLMLAVLRLVFAWGLPRRKCSTNPAVGVNGIRRPRATPVKNRPWRPEELETVLAAAPGWLQVPIAIAAYTGLRESDVCRVTWSCYDGIAFEIRTQKTNTPVRVPAHYRLREILDTRPRAHDRIVLGARGHPVGGSTVTGAFFILVKKLHSEGGIGAGLSFHGLRHTLGTVLAEMGCDPPTIAAVLGQSTTQMAEHYSRTADRRHLAGAAIERFEQRDRKRDAENTRENSL